MVSVMGIFRQLSGFCCLAFIHTFTTVRVLEPIDWLFQTDTNCQGP